MTWLIVAIIWLIVALLSYLAVRLYQTVRMPGAVCRTVGVHRQAILMAAFWPVTAHWLIKKRVVAWWMSWWPAWCDRSGLTKWFTDDRPTRW